MTPKKILLATDLSCRCDRALDRATLLAAEWHAQLVVLHVVQQPAPVPDLPSWRRPVDPLEAARQRIREDVGDAEGVEIEVVIEQGDPAPRILDVVERTGVDLIVTGVARDETLGRMLLGTTVDAVVRKANVPVLVVKKRPRRPYRNVVVATDFSEGSRSALEAALALLPEAQISLFHAFSVPFDGLMDDKVGGREAAARLVLADSHAFLAETPAAASAQHAIPTFAEHGDPGPLLEDLVRTRRVDLVALGTEGRSALAHVFLGSVAQLLLARVPSDALVVRRRRT